MQTGLGKIGVELGEKEENSVQCLINYNLIVGIGGVCVCVCVYGWDLLGVIKLYSCCAIYSLHC